MKTDDREPVTRLDEEDRSQVQVAFVTTDPKVDTPPVMQDYLDGYGFEGQRAAVPYLPHDRTRFRVI